MRTRRGAGFAAFCFSFFSSWGGFGGVGWFQLIEKLVLKFQLFMLSAPKPSPSLSLGISHHPLGVSSSPWLLHNFRGDPCPVPAFHYMKAVKEDAFSPRVPSEGLFCGPALRQGSCGHFGRSGNSELLRRPISHIPVEACGGLDVESLLRVHRAGCHGPVSADPVPPAWACVCGDIG